MKRSWQEGQDGAVSGVIRKQSLPQQIQRELIDFIVREGYQAGDQLPTEPEICAQFGASRTAVREAMKYLEILGVVSIEPGRGTFLQPFDIGHLLGNLPMQLIFRPEDIMEVIQVRQLLEGYCLEQAIVRAGRTGLEQLEHWVNAMAAKAASAESMDEEDTCFHRQLACMAGSHLLLMVLEVFWDLRRRLPVDNSPEALVRRHLRHRRLYEAIKMRDLQLARLMLAEHFSGSYQELLSDVEDRTSHLRAADNKEDQGNAQ
ncbi:MAG: FadR/GntR family transcriptional regulator [Limnochordia bacterium]|jgi:GntR family transcriptional repressor for pyruvate dehydrogenase complex